MGTAIANPTPTKTSVRLEVTAIYVNKKCNNARYAEDHFADVVGNAIRPHGGRVSNWGVKARTKKGWPVDTLVWRDADSPFAKSALNVPPETEKALREMASLIKSALAAEYKDVEVTLAYEVTTFEKL